MDFLLTDLISDHGRRVGRHDTEDQGRNAPPLPSVPGAEGSGEAGHEITLQRVLLDRPVGLRALYWRLTPATGSTGPGGRVRADCISLEPGAVLSFDAYFNAFYEQNWRGHTALGTVFLNLDLHGTATLRVIRRISTGYRCAGAYDKDCERQYVDRCVVEQLIEGAGPLRVAIPAETINFRQHGMLAFEIVAHSPVEFGGGRWTTEVAAPRRTGLAAIFCTFNRQADIAAVLEAITADEAAASSLARIYVVNQGDAGLDAHPAVAPVLARCPGLIRIIEQANFGGAGGFGRGLLAALDDPEATHAVLLDDDIRIEPDSLLRMASFFALALGDNPVGGHMLDRVQPTQLYEAGAVIRDANWSFHPQHHGLDIAARHNLPLLTDPYPIQFNGWWCLGLPLSLIEEEGMPLPCFIRGDDVEFGLRLYGRGVPTLPLPGIAVWHEPFYLKIGGWQLYYETRNMLITSAIHTEVGGAGMAVRMARALLLHLLTFRYYSAALILEAIQDALRGPALFDGQPRAIHAGLATIRKRFPDETVARGVVLPEQAVRPSPKGRIAWLSALAGSILWSAMRPTAPGAPPRRLLTRDLGWSRLRSADCLAVETWWDRDLPVFRRSREDFRKLSRMAVPLLLRLWREAPAFRRSWREAFPRHSSVSFWRKYLGLCSGAGPKPR